MRHQRSVDLDDDAYQRARNMAAHLRANNKQPATWTALVNQALRNELRRLERLHTGRQPAPPHPGRLASGVVPGTSELHQQVAAELDRQGPTANGTTIAQALNITPRTARAHLAQLRNET